MPVSESITTTIARARKSQKSSVIVQASRGCHLIEAGDVRDLEGGFDLSGEGPQP